MAKVIAPFKIIGTLDDLIFYEAQNKENLVRRKGENKMTSEMYKTLPSFQKVRNHSKEFGRCAKKAQLFRYLSKKFSLRAQDHSYCGRANKLMYDVLFEDLTNTHGNRTIEKGMESPDSKGYFLGFEGNILRPLNSVLKTNWTWNEITGQFAIDAFNPAEHIDWPEQAQQVHLAVACGNWNYIDNNFITAYSEEIIFEKEEPAYNICLNAEIPQENHFQLLYIFIAFSYKDRKRVKELKRAHNTFSIIWCR